MYYLIRKTTIQKCVPHLTPERTIVFQLNLRLHVYAPKFFFGRPPKSFASQAVDWICDRGFYGLETNGK
jgi:hypothetical protein